VVNIEQLYRRAKDDLDGYEDRLFRELTVRLRPFAYRMTGDSKEAEDAVQDAMVHIINGYRKGTFKDSFFAWAHTVLKHTVYNRARKVRRRRKLMETFKRQTDNWTFQPNLDLESRLFDCLRALVLSNRRYARVLNLQYQGYGTEQICSKLKVTRGHFYVLLSRARVALRTCLDNGGPNE
jgi:RNA polymerase sigma factor (sigma-70 family)